jgi:uncharacterized protein with HEPN domain
LKDDTLYLIHIFECITRIESYVHGIDFERFQEDSLTQDAVLRNLQIMAESTQRLSDMFKENHQDIEWAKISGLRNILVHDYLGVDLEVVWNIIASRLPQVKIIIKDYIPEIPQQPSA